MDQCNSLMKTLSNLDSLKVPPRFQLPRAAEKHFARARSLRNTNTLVLKNIDAMEPRLIPYMPKNPRGQPHRFRIDAGEGPVTCRDGVPGHVVKQDRILVSDRCAPARAGANLAKVQNEQSAGIQRRAGKLLIDLQHTRIDEVLANGLHACLTQFLALPRPLRPSCRSSPAVWPPDRAPGTPSPAKFPRPRLGTRSRPSSTRSFHPADEPGGTDRSDRHAGWRTSTARRAGAIARQ
ncbi:MAG: hypothetical protein EOO22_05195 [Comamonadaceae bacterium]|nr:MAG: hypothetical protein EOO22_05195 [Comamonadaceae bacterium]